MGQAIAKGTATKVREVAINNVVVQIRRHLDDADKAETRAHEAEVRCFESRLAAGQKLLRLRERVEAGEGGEGVKWWEWFKQAEICSRKGAERLMKIAGSDDPVAALKEEREKDRDRKRIARSKSNGANAPVEEENGADNDVVRSKEPEEEAADESGEPEDEREGEVIEGAAEGEPEEMDPQTRAVLWRSNFLSTAEEAAEEAEEIEEWLSHGYEVDADMVAASAKAAQAWDAATKKLRREQKQQKQEKQRQEEAA
jgi:hypothetical protein